MERFIIRGATVATDNLGPYPVTQSISARPRPHHNPMRSLK